MGGKPQSPAIGPLVRPPQNVLKGHDFPGVPATGRRRWGGLNRAAMPPIENDCHPERAQRVEGPAVVFALAVALQVRGRKPASLQCAKGHNFSCAE